MKTEDKKAIAYLTTSSCKQSIKFLVEEEFDIYETYDVSEVLTMLKYYFMDDTAEQVLKQLECKVTQSWVLNVEKTEKYGIKMYDEPYFLDTEKLVAALNEMAA